MPSAPAIVPGVDTDTPQISMLRRIIASAVVILLALALGAFGFAKLAALRKESQRTMEVPPAPLVRAEQALAQDYQEVLRGFGKAMPLRGAEVVSEVAGSVRDISPLLEVGTEIARKTEGEGDDTLPILVRLDDRDLDDLLERAKAEFAVAEAEAKRLKTNRGSLQARAVVVAEEVAAATRELRRIAGLVPRTLSKSDQDAQSLQVNARQRQLLVVEALIADNAGSSVAAAARLDVLTRAVSLAQREKTRALIRAPFPGRVVARHVNLGERVRVGDPLFTIVDLSRVEVPVALPARRYTEVHPGAPARARMPDTKGLIWEGVVSRVAPTIQAEDRTFYAYVVIQGEPGRNPAPPGAHLLVEVEGRLHPKVFAVPRRAFLGDRIFVAQLDGDTGEAVIEVRTPTVARLLPGAALVTEGLKNGEYYLVTNIESVAAGSRVRIAPAALAPGTSAPDTQNPPSDEDTATRKSTDGAER